MKALVGPCEDCAGTAWYGDNGPGIPGNAEFVRCDCGPATKCTAGWHKMITQGANTTRDRRQRRKDIPVLPMKATEWLLRYIGHPAQPEIAHGGFGDTTIQAARSALHHFARLRRRANNIGGRITDRGGHGYHGYHCTTPAKLARYQATGCILSPVRFWPSEDTARKWMTRTGRTVLLRIPVSRSWPLPDHKPARWTDDLVRTWEVLS